MELELLNCICGRKPKIGNKKVAYNVKYKYYYCPKCEIFTFATCKIEFCKELWNANIIKKLKLCLKN